MLKQIGQYRLLSELGSGGMGIVYRALDLELQREVALKRLRSEFAASSTVLERFRNEAKLQGRLNHPNIAQLYSLVQTPEAFCIVMEFVRGAVVQELLPLKWEEAIALLLQVLSALDCAHTLGVLHRDMKPENIIIDISGTVKVMDFGIAYAVGSDRMTREKSLIGTMEYMPPERILGRDITARSDIYSLGILLFEMLSGKLPFGTMSEYDLLRWQVEQNAPPVTGFVDVPPVLNGVIARAMNKDPEQRYASCAAMAQDLTPLLHGVNLQAGLALLVHQRMEVGEIFDRKACFARTWSALDLGEMASAEKMLRNAVHRHPDEPDLHRYSRLVSRAVFEMERTTSERRAEAIKRLLCVVAAEMVGDREAADAGVLKLRADWSETGIGALI
jgi:serine/threonine protein kinase